jgi:hypothetical protein
MRSSSVLRPLLLACALAAVVPAALPACSHAAIAHVGATSATSTATTISVNKPGGTTQNDLMIATVFVTGADPVTAAGWTAVAGASATTATGDGRLMSFYKVAAASEPSTYSFGTAASGGGAREATAAISAYRGADLAAPVEGGGGEAGGSTGQASAPAPVTSYPNSVAITAVGFRGIGTGPGSRIGFSSGSSRWAVFSNDVAAELVDQVVADAGTAPAVTATSNHTYTGWASNSLAIREEPALTASFPAAYAWGAWGIGTNTSAPQTVSVTTNRSWGLKLSSDQADGRMSEWNGATYSSRRLGSALRWRLSSLAGAPQGTSFAPLSSTPGTAVSGQPAARGAVAAAITYSQSVSYADDAGLGGNSYRSVVSYQAGQGF